MQEPLFESKPDAAIVDDDHDPYAAVDEAGLRIAEGYGIEAERASDMVLTHGSELAARRALERRWWIRPDQKAA